MKRIALAGVGLAILIIVGMVAFNWWGFHAASKNAPVVAANRVIGNPDGSLTIVEFVDYQCPYCQQIHKTLMTIQKDDPDLRIVFRALPWLKDSGQIAAFVVAAGNQGKEVELHKALLNKETPQNLFAAKQVAAGLGIDVAKAERDQESPAVLNQVTENLNVAMDLHLQSTPALLIGKTLYVPTMDNMPTVAQLREMIETEKGKK